MAELFDVKKLVENITKEIIKKEEEKLLL